jgi:hypothetical protein
MLHEDHHHGVEHARFVRAWKPSEYLEKRHLAKIDDTNDLGTEIQTMNLDLSGCRPGDIGLDFVPFHFNLMEQWDRS